MTAAQHETAEAELGLVDLLCSGDEAAFASLIDEHHRSMVRVARLYVRDPAAAEDVVQETWLAVVKGIDRFDGRSTLKTWLYRILTNRAKTAAERQSRTTPVGVPVDDGAAAVPASRFRSSSSDWGGHWSAPPSPWPAELDDSLVAAELLRVVLAAIDCLPSSQRSVITLRDVECWSAAEVCDLLDLTDSNQRVLLHRARSAVRGSIESYHDRGGLR
jgi:RNA polymerase sigma-70 factor, ECF subfamily